MKKIFILFLGILMVLVGFGVTDIADEKEAVKKAIVSGYIEGIFLKGDPELVKKGWHEECDIFMLRDKKLQKLPASYWVERLEKKSGPPRPDVKVTYEFEDVRVVGYAALAVVKIFADGKQKYTDFMNLYKFDSGWKIVTKTFYDHF
jgi:hypothetical protein